MPLLALLKPIHDLIQQPAALHASQRGPAIVVTKCHTTRARKVPKKLQLQPVQKILSPAEIETRYAEYTAGCEGHCHTAFPVKRHQACHRGNGH